MEGVQGASNRLMPFLLLAAGLHGAILFTVRLDAQSPAMSFPTVSVLDAALELGPNPSSAATPGNAPIPLPAAPSASAASAGPRDLNQVLTLPARAESGETTARTARRAAPPALVQPRVAAEAPLAPSAPRRDPGRSEPPTRRAAVAPETRRPETRPISEPSAESGSGSEAAEPAPERARLTSDVLSRQISEWTTAYAETRAREAALPPRTAHVEKVTTHRYAADAYERDWQDKVERVGNLNYPEEARRKNLSGGLLLSVGVNADGSLKGITVAKSSGHAELDEAAVRIVRLAAPFAPFPSQLKTDYDVLLITRTWRFFTDHHLATAP